MGESTFSMDEVTRLAESIADLLEIDCQEIVAVEGLHSKTQIAVYTDDTIYIRKDIIRFDACFALAHEMRHVWQMKTDKERYFGNYKIIGECDTEKYNLQLAEIDANAFAGLVMMSEFKVKPLFQGLSDDAKNEIYKHIDKLAEEYNC